MTWTAAPLYVEAHDLACWLAQRARWAQGPDLPLAHALEERGRELLCAVSRALALPERRDSALRRADALLVDLRVLLRLAVDLGLLSPRRARFAIGRADRAGRMLGGWRKSRALRS